MNADTLVWFRREDHAGLVRRLLACLIDAAIIMAVLATPGILLQKMHADGEQASAARTVGASAVMLFGLFVSLLVAAPYHLLLRRTRGGTIGYRLTGVRLITMADAIPSWATLVRRFALSLIIPLLLYALMTPVLVARGQIDTPKHKQTSTPGQTIGGAIMFSIFFVIIFGNYWMIIRDPHRQALHDKWSRTWVVRSGARPAGTGTPIERAWILGPFVLGYWDVDPVEEVANIATV